MNEKIKYPRQVGSIKRSKKVLGIDAELHLPTEEEILNTPPLAMHSGYSRFEVSLIDKDQDAVAVANIPANDVFYIKQKTEIAMDRIVDAQYVKRTATAVSKPKSIAYTQQIMADKNFKGKTPAEILINTPENKELLIRTRDWLSANLSKYPRNKPQIDAINEALDLFDTGMLSSEDAAEYADTYESMITVYDSGSKFKTKKNEKGFNLVYDIKITCEQIVMLQLNLFHPVKKSLNLLKRKT